MFGYDLGIDLGTGSIVISVVGKGVVLDEPSYVAYDTESEKVIYAGKRAYFLQGREPKGVEVVQPIVNGAVSNYSLACQMVRHFINRVIKRNIFRPRVVASVPSISTDVERRILISVIINAGGNTRNKAIALSGIIVNNLAMFFQFRPQKGASLQFFIFVFLHI